jgi:CDP-diacylglycerol--glycerol-3-phosphate 3-phosphatidyltransferase
MGGAAGRLRVLLFLRARFRASLPLFDCFLTALAFLAYMLSCLIAFSLFRVLGIVFVLFDLLDGTIARLSEKGSNAWGALLDSTLDRLTDAVILGSILWFMISEDDPLVPLVLLTIVLGFLISYIKARAESLGIECNGGLAERTERIIIVLTTVGFAGLGVDYIMGIGFWVLAIASLVTVVQRLRIVYIGAK